MPRTIDENMIAMRLPPITAELILETMRLEMERDAHSATWCREHGIGVRRVKLGHCDVRPVKIASSAAGVIEVARDEARALLSEMCRVCPLKCIMKDW